MTIKEIIEKIVIIIFIILAIIIGYQIIKSIFGGTWTTENIIIAGMGMILTGLFVMVGFLMNQSKSIGVLEERTKNIGESLTKLGSDFKEHLREKHKSY